MTSTEAELPFAVRGRELRSRPQGFLGDPRLPRPAQPRQPQARTEPRGRSRGWSRGRPAS